MSVPAPNAVSSGPASLAGARSLARARLSPFERLTLDRSLAIGSGPRRCEQLLRAGAHPDGAGGKGEPLLMAAQRGADAEIALLIEAGARVFHPKLGAALGQFGSKASVGLIVSKGFDLSAPGGPWERQDRDSPRNALSAAVCHGRIEMAKALIGLGARADALDPEGVSAMGWLLASAPGAGSAQGKLRVSQARALLRLGCPPNGHAKDGGTLLGAALRESEPMARALIDAGALCGSRYDLKIAIDEGHSWFTPLWIEASRAGLAQEDGSQARIIPLCSAAARGDEKSARALIAAGEKASGERNPQGLSPLDMAAQGGAKARPEGLGACARLLLAEGANPTERAADGCSPMQRALRQGNFAVAEVLDGAGAIKDKRARVEAYQAVRDWIAMHQGPESAGQMARARSLLDRWEITEQLRRAQKASPASATPAKARL